MAKPTEVHIKGDVEMLDLLTKGLRLVRVYGNKEVDWITNQDRKNAKKLMKIIESKRLEYYANLTDPLNPQPLCDPETNCDW